MTSKKELFFALAAVLLGIVGVTGCASLPRYDGPPKVDLGAGWAGAPAAATEDGQTEVELDAWWTALGDPTLSRLIAEALVHNLDLLQAAERIAEARAALDRVDGRRYPQVDARADVIQRRQSENGPLPIGRIPDLERDQTVHEIGADASWEIDLFGRFGRTLESANAKLEATEDDAAGLRLSLVAEVARTYFALRGAQRERLAHEATIDALLATRDLTRQRVEAGDVAPAELGNVEAKLAALRTALPGLDARVEASALALGTLLGGLPEKELAIVQSLPAELSLPPLPIGQRADLLRRRPDVRGTERRLAASTAEVGLAMAEKFPKLRINASGGFQALALAELFEAGSLTYSVTPFFSWRIFDGGRVEAEIHGAQARERNAALGYEKSVLAALGEAERAMSDYRHALDSLAAQRLVVEATGQIHETSLLRFDAGDINRLEVLEAERTLNEAREAEVKSATQAAVGWVGAVKALGGGWSAADRGANARKADSNQASGVDPVLGATVVEP